MIVVCSTGKEQANNSECTLIHKMVLTVYQYGMLKIKANISKEIPPKLSYRQTQIFFRKGYIQMQMIVRFDHVW